jgi:hypothetical protein
MAQTRFPGREKGGRRLDWGAGYSAVITAPIALERGKVALRLMSFDFASGAQIFDRVVDERDCLDEFAVEWDRCRAVIGRISTVRSHWIAHAWGSSWAGRARLQSFECHSWCDDPREVQW